MIQRHQYINEAVNFRKVKNGFVNAKPFNHLVIENFLNEKTLNSVVKEFPSYDEDVWDIYDNPLENKRTACNWVKFPETVYRLIQFLNSMEFVEELETLVGCKLYADYGLNGAGLHTHKKSGKLNVHMDYSIHPKLKLERRLNLLVYLTPDWQEEWGGSLGFWGHDAATNSPKDMEKSIAPLFNRAVLFDTTQNSWHGLPDPIQCPKGVTRNSIAMYYLCEPRADAPTRGKALFHPHTDQKNDPMILDLIQKRSQVASANSVYINTKEPADA